MRIIKLKSTLMGAFSVASVGKIYGQHSNLFRDVKTYLNLGVLIKIFLFTNSICH